MFVCPTVYVRLLQSTFYNRRRGFLFKVGEVVVVLWALVKYRCLNLSEK